MSQRPSIVCPECKGTGVDDSDTPVVVVIEMSRDGTKRDAPCFMCFGHGRVFVNEQESK